MKNKTMYLPLIVVNIAIGIFITIIQPYNMGDESLILRFSYWLILFHFGYVVNFFTDMFLRYVFSPIEGLVRLGLLIFLASVICSFPISMAIFYLSYWFFDVEKTWSYYYSYTLLWNFFIYSTYGVWLQGKKQFLLKTLSKKQLLLSLFGLQNILENYQGSLFPQRQDGRQDDKNNDSVNPSSVASHSLIFQQQVPERIRELLPEKISSAMRIIWIKSADHYLEVMTDLGGGHIRMRLKDATAIIDETGLSIGKQCHRSYWVAFAEVKQIKGSQVILEDGKTIPLGERFKKEFIEGLEGLREPQK